MVVGARAEAGSRPAPRTEPGGTPGRRLDVQGLRAVAVLLVVGYHAGLPLPGGFVGVDVFFVISGFVITAMLQREWQAQGRLSFTRFYLRRIKRLTPALALMVSVTVLLSALFLSPLGAQQATAQTAIGAMLIVANAVIARTTGDYFDAPAETNALLHTWSLSVEEQFYLVFPVVLAVSWLLARRVRARWIPVTVCAGVTIFSFSVAVLVSTGFQPQQGEMLVGFYGPLTRVWEFSAGALLALAPTLSAPRGRRVGWGESAAGALLLVTSVALISSDTPFPGLWTVLPVLGTMLLIRSGGGAGNPTTRVLRSRPMVRIGDLSYSIYLWHWPFIVFASVLWPQQALAPLLAAVVSVGPAVASYTFVEQPIRMAWPSSGRRMRRLVAACVVPPVLMAGLLGFASERGFWSETVKAHQEAVLEPHGGCYGYVPLTDSTAGECTTNAQAVGRPIYLVGDSHAQHFSEAAFAAGEALNRPVVVSTATNCPVISVELRFTTGTEAHNTGCRSFAQGTIDYLLAATPGVVVLAASDRYWTDADFSAGLTPQTMTTRTDAKLTMAGDATTDLVTRLREVGHDVVLVLDVPRWVDADEWSPSDCTVVSMLSGYGSCERRMPLARASSRQGAVRTVVKDVADQTGAGMIDTWPVMCPDGWCSTHDGGLTAYRDSNHITVPRSAEFSDDFRQAIVNLS